MKGYRRVNNTSPAAGVVDFGHKYKAQHLLETAYVFLGNSDPQTPILRNYLASSTELFKYMMYPSFVGEHNIEF